MFKRLALTLSALAVSGCATPGALRIENLDRPLAQLQKIASTAMPLGLRETSPNGREYFSNYFEVQGRKFRPVKAQATVRRYAHVLVLGDRRPYAIEVLVPIEKRLDQSAYSQVGQDLRIAKAIRKRLQGLLNKRREDSNIIDDFRVF